MKFVLIVLATLLAGQAANAASSIENFESAVGAEIMVRQVLDQKLLKGENKIYRENLKFALEGAGDRNISSNMTKVECDAGLGSSYCTIHFYVEAADKSKTTDPEGGEFAFDLVVRIYQGKVISAHVANQAG